MARLFWAPEASLGRGTRGSSPRHLSRLHSARGPSQWGCPSWALGSPHSTRGSLPSVPPGGAPNAGPTLRLAQLGSSPGDPGLQPSLAGLPHIPHTPLGVLRSRAVVSTDQRSKFRGHYFPRREWHGEAGGLADFGASLAETGSGCGSSVGGAPGRLVLPLGQAPELTPHMNPKSSLDFTSVPQSRVPSCLTEETEEQRVPCSIV